MLTTITNQPFADHKRRCNKRITFRNKILKHLNNYFMKKILIAFNGEYYPGPALDFALTLNKTQPVLLTGVFIPQATYSYLWTSASAAVGPTFPPLLEEVSSEIVEANIRKFKAFCQTNNIQYKVHTDIYDFVLPELIKETRFADLLVIDSEKFYESISREEEASHLRDVLQSSECPVLVIPEKFQFPGKNILAYDGSQSSVYAIKQFAYLFPEFADNETVVVFSEKEGDGELPYESYIQELARQHYKNFQLLKLEIDPKEYFSTWLSEEKKPILVTGSFGKRSIFKIFRKSFVQDVIEERTLPVFIAHK